MCGSLYPFAAHGSHSHARTAEEKLGKAAHRGDARRTEQKTQHYGRWWCGRARITSSSTKRLVVCVVEESDWAGDAPIPGGGSGAGVEVSQQRQMSNVTGARGRDGWTLHCRRRNTYCRELARAVQSVRQRGKVRRRRSQSRCRLSVCELGGLWVVEVVVVAGGHSRSTMSRRLENAQTSHINSSHLTLHIGHVWKRTLVCCHSQLQVCQMPA